MRIRRTTPIDGHNGWLRFGWEFVDDDERILGEGMSVGRVADDAFNDRDADTMRGLLAEDVVWHIPGNHPMAGTYQGLDEVWDLLPLADVAQPRADRGPRGPDQEMVDRLITQAVREEVSTPSA